MMRWPVFFFLLCLLPGLALGQTRRVILKATGADIVTVVGAAVPGLGAYNDYVVTWQITAADRADADETYDMYVMCGDGITSWDAVHFPQVVTTGAKTYVARMAGTVRPENVTTAAPGVAANDPATLRTDTAGADQGDRTLGAGLVRHGPCGDRLHYELVIAGTTPSITSSLTITAR